MTDQIQFDPADLREKSPEKAFESLDVLETQIRNKVSQLRSGDERSAFPVGVPFVDWLVDQILFVSEAWTLLQAQGLPDGDALWLLEMLSLPECQRRARRKWQRKRLLQEALVKENLRWRDVLLNRRRGENVGYVPRQLQFHTRQLTPYGSAIRSPKRWPSPWKFPLDLFLSIHSWPAGGGSTLQPLRSGSSLSFSIQLRTPVGTLLLDIPRDYNNEQCVKQLLYWRDQLDRCLARLEDGSLAVPSPGEGEKRFTGLLGWGRAFAEAHDTESLRGVWRELRRDLNQDIERLSQRKLKRSKWAAIMQKHFAIPLAMSPKPKWVLPLDLQGVFLPMFIAVWMFMQGLLSIRQRRRVVTLIERELLLLDPEIEPQRAHSLVPEVIWRLGRFNRPLRGASVRYYLRLVLRRGRLSNREDIRERRAENFENEMETAIGSEKLLDLESIYTPDRKRVPRGSLQEVARRLGCVPRTVARRYRRYCQRRKLSPASLAAWACFRKDLSRSGHKRPNARESSPI